MGLVQGTRLGPYEITGQIGVGGMGEVYRATDSNLKRSVAIKVLPDAFASDVERLARFQREAEVLASLNHTNIAAIYGLERAGGTTALVMELVEGPTLADRIAVAPIALTRRCRLPGKSPKRSRRHTSTGSSTAISNPRTSSSEETVRSRCWISAWPRRWSPQARRLWEWLNPRQLLPRP